MADNEGLYKSKLSNLRNNKLLIPVIAVLVSFILGAIVMLIGGYNPIRAYQALFSTVLGSSYDIGEAIRAMIPLILSGFAVAVANKAGLLNIGVDGQIAIGSVSSLMVGVLVDLPPVLHGLVAIVAGVLAGGLWGAFIAYLRTKFNINEVISAIMLNYVALYISHILIRIYVHQEGTSRSALIQESASIRLQGLSEMFSGARIHWGFIVTPIIIVLFYYFIEKTRWGYETKVVGLNRDASTYAGMNTKNIIVRTMFFSGAIGGLIGAIDTLGVYGYMAISSTTSGIGFDGIAIALLGNNSTIGTTLAGIFIGALNYGSQGMQFSEGVPSEIIGIIISIIIYFIAAAGIVRALLPNRLLKKKEAK